MRAFRMMRWGESPRFDDVEVPEAGPGQVLVKVAACGLCHSDLGIIDHRPGASDNMLPVELPVPFTLGHETAGWIEAAGVGLQALEPGTPVALPGVNSCGECDACIRGRDDGCWMIKRFQSRGCGYDGGLAEYVLAPAREAIPLGSLSPFDAPPLTDAGVTSYAAVKRALPVLRPGTTAIVIGVGGLGSYAIQHLRALTSTRIIGIDNRPEQLELARSLGADEAVLSDESVNDAIKELTAGEGVDAALDFVGTDSTLETALAVTGAMGTIVVCGMVGGAAKVSWATIAPGTQLVFSLGSTLADLTEVIGLAQRGAVHLDADHYAFADTPDAYADLTAGKIRTRAVVDVSTRPAGSAP